MANGIIKEKIHAKGIDITIYSTDFIDKYISLTDIAKYKSIDANATICNWMRNRETLEFLGLWESLYNRNFKPLELEGFRKEAGLNAFLMSPSKWITSVNALGIISKAGRGGGTYAHSDIALEFASWISASFKLHIITDYRRIKADENRRLSLNWNLSREISKLNYRIHTDAIKENLLPPELTPAQIAFTYADEADVINVALFGVTAKQWREVNKNKKGNIRDYANINYLLVLANLESYNAILINQKRIQSERLIALHNVATQQLKALEKIVFESIPSVSKNSKKKLT